MAWGIDSDSSSTKELCHERFSSLGDVGPGGLRLRKRLGPARRLPDVWLLWLLRDGHLPVRDVHLRLLRLRLLRRVAADGESLEFVRRREA